MGNRGIRIYILLIAIFLGGFLAPFHAEAQGYRFSVPRMEMQVYVQPDASVRVEYEIEFHNDPRGRTLDAVDVGLFHGNYNLREMNAFLDGRPLRHIGKSPYVTGVEVNLMPQGIPPGEKGVFKFSARMPEMVYQDTTRGDYASLRVTPTWFGSQFVTGTTRLRIAIHMLPGMEEEEILYHDTPFSGKALFQNRMVAYWEFPSVRIDGPYHVGISFPKRGMDRVIRLTKWDLLVMWWEGTPEAQITSGAILLVIFGILFFMMTAGTGFSAFVMVAGIVGFLFYISPVFHLISIPFMPFLFWLMWIGVKRGNKGRKKYLPPIASVEGGGIKRGLTAPEAAVLLELSPGKLITLVLFGLMKKGIITMINDEPLTVAVNRDYTVDRKERLAKAAENGVVIHAYEHPFLEALKLTTAAVSEIDLSEEIKKLIDYTVDRLAGYDLKETKEYYRNIIKRAWADAENLGEVEQRQKSVDRNLEWMLMKDNYRDDFSRWDRGGFRYCPVWLGPGYYRRGYGGGIRGMGGGSLGSGPLGGSGGGAAGSGGFTPKFGDVAGSFAGWTENLAGQASSAILPQDIGMKSGLIDLSGMDRATGNFFEALSSGSGSGYGGGGGCACAGCACACACAGGGR